MLNLNPSVYSEARGSQSKSSHGYSGKSLLKKLNKIYEAYFIILIHPGLSRVDSIQYNIGPTNLSRDL